MEGGSRDDYYLQFRPAHIWPQKIHEAHDIRSLRPQASNMVNEKAQSEKGEDKKGGTRHQDIHPPPLKW